MSTVPHPHKFTPTHTDECTLCGGHFDDGTPYVQTELEAWTGRDAVLCGKCIDAMYQATHKKAGVKK